MQFSTGDFIEGTLTGIQQVQIKDKSAIRYIVQLDSGEMVCFLGTWQINSKLRPADKGHRIIVCCKGEDVMVKRGDNCMKVFEVQVSRERVDGNHLPSSANPEITDDDIPF